MSRISKRMNASNTEHHDLIRSQSDFPMNGATVVCISSIDWNFLWQGHQEIMSRLASAGNRVIFIENMGGVRAVRLSDARRVLRRLRRWATSTRLGKGPREQTPVTIVAPLLVPFPASRLARAANRFLIGRLASHVRSLAGMDPILFTYLPTSEALSLVQRLRG